jgi:hypothetical protein
MGRPEPGARSQKPEARSLDLWSVVSPKGQAASEYVIVLAAIAAALVIMQLYLYRAYSGNVRRQSQSLSTIPFSPAYGNYTMVRENAPYNMVQNKSFQGHMAGQVFRTDSPGQASRSGGGNLENTTLSHDGVDVSGIQGNLRSLGVDNVVFPEYKNFTDNVGELPSDFSVSDRTAAVDDFSGRSMTDDKFDVH